MTDTTKSGDYAFWVTIVIGSLFGSPLVVFVACGVWGVISGVR